MEDFITLKQLQAYDKLKVPGVIYVEELPENPENAIYGIKHEDKETVEYTTKFIDILATYFTEYSSGKFTINEDYEAEVDGTAFASAALVSGKYFIYSEDRCQGLLPGDYSPYDNYTFSISEDIVHTDFYTGKKEDKTYVKLANVDEVERYFIRKEQKGKANGVASLDANGRVPVEQMPVQAFVYLGQWDASTGVFPPDADTPGDFYEVNVAGTIEGIEFLVGDWLVWTTSGWDKSENKNYVNSVNKKRGEVEVYGDNTEIETPSDTEETDTRTIKQYIDDITVDGNTWNEGTQDITSKAVLDEEALPETVEDKVYRLNAETETEVVVYQRYSLQEVINLGFEILEDDGTYATLGWHTTTDKVVIKDVVAGDDREKVRRITYRRGVNDPISYVTEDGWNHYPTQFAIFKIYEYSYSVYAKDTKLVTDNEWQADRENIAYKNKENTFTETNTFDAIKANSIGKDNTEITFEGDTVDVTGDLQVKCIKEPEAIEIETPALTQNGKYVVTEVDGVDTDVDGKTESIAVVDVTALPATPKDKVYTIKGEEPEPISSTIPLDKERLLALYDSCDKTERPDGLIQCQNFQGDVTLYVDGVKQTKLDSLVYNPQVTYWQTIAIDAVTYEISDASRITYEVKQLPIDKAYAKDVRLATYSELADADKIRTVDNIEPTKDKNVTTKVELTKEAYTQLVAAGMDDPNVTYYVTDEQPSADFINDFIVSSGLTWSSRKIRDAIEAATPVIINDAIKALTTTYSSEKIVQLIAEAISDKLTKTEAATLYQPVGDYATNTAISDMLTKTEASTTYEPKNSDLATKTYVSGNYQPKGSYATTDDISDMATKTWVGNQGYLTSIPEGIITESNFKTELQKYIYAENGQVIFNL